jgi:uncharacterized membrane protein
MSIERLSTIRHLKISLQLYALALLIFLVLDFTWLLGIAPDLYKAEMGALLRSEPNMLAAFAFYAIFIAGLVFFVLLPAWQTRSITRAGITGAAFGFVTYATYDLTAMAVIAGFSTKIGLIDLVWGTCLGAATSGLTLALARRFWS